MAATRWSGAESDQALADTIKKAGNVILLADATYDGESSERAAAAAGHGFPSDAPGVRRTPRDLSAVAGAGPAPAAALGHNFFVLDPDGPLRHVVPFVTNRRSHVMPSLGLAAALRPPASRRSRCASTAIDSLMRRPADAARKAAREERGRHREAISGGSIHFRGPAFLADMKQPPVPALLILRSALLGGADSGATGSPTSIPSLFRDKIVFVGVTAAGLFDVFETPFAGGRMPGIQIHASVADDFLSNRFMRPRRRGPVASRPWLRSRCWSA